MKRIAAILCSFLLLFSTTACSLTGGDSVTAYDDESNQKNDIFGAALQEKDRGQLFEKTVLSLPDIGIYLNGAMGIEDGYVLLYGTNPDNKYQFFTMDVSDFSVNSLAVSVDEPLIDLCTDGAGTLYLLTQDANGDYSVTSYNSDGKSNCKLMTSEVLNKEEEPLWEIIKMPSGYLLASPQYVFAFAEDGSFIKKYGPYRGISLITAGEDTLICLSSSVDEGTTIYKIDEVFNISSTYKLPNSYLEFYSGEQNVIFAQSANTIFALDYAENKRVGFVNAFMSGGSMNCFTYVNESEFLSIENGLPVLWNLFDGDRSVTTVTLASYAPDVYLTMAVSTFNESSADVKIDLMDYSLYDEEGKTSAGLARLKADIIAGNTPDIYDLSCLSANSYAKKGLLEDLMPFFSREQDVSYTDLVESVVKALEKDGHLYDFVPSFYITSLCGDSQIIGEGSGWTIEDFFALAQNYAPDELLGPEMTRDAFLQLILAFGEDNFFDYDTATCNFTSDEFMEVLTYMKQLPEQYEDDGYQNRSRAYCGYQKLLYGSWGEYFILDILINNAVFNGRANYIGFPSSYNVGAAALPVMHLGMSSSSGEKEAVWKFFQFLLSENYQSNFIELNGKAYEGRWQLPGIPIVASNLSKRMDYWVDMYSDMPAQLGTFAGDTAVIIEGTMADETTREQAKALIDKVSCLYMLDEEIYSIVAEVSLPFFAGDKSVTEVAMQIQSRVSIYLSEQYG